MEEENIVDWGSSVNKGLEVEGRPYNGESYQRGREFLSVNWES